MTSDVSLACQACSRRVGRGDAGDGSDAHWAVPQVSLQVTLAILAATNAVGTLCTIFVPDAKRMTLKDGALRAQSLFEKLIGGQVRRSSFPCRPHPLSVALVAAVILPQTTASEPVNDDATLHRHTCAFATPFLRNDTA